MKHKTTRFILLLTALLLSFYISAFPSAHAQTNGALPVSNNQFSPGFDPFRPSSLHANRSDLLANQNTFASSVSLNIKALAIDFGSGLVPPTNENVMNGRYWLAYNMSLMYIK